MFFRVYILLIILATRLLFTDISFVALLGLIWLLPLPVRGKSYYKAKKKAQVHQPRSLSFFIQSMSRQKTNFRMINKVFAKSLKLQKFFKELSILLDDINVEFVHPGYDISMDTTRSRTDDITCASRSYLPQNVHRHD